MTSPYSTLLVDTAGGVRTLTLNRPEVRNAMSLQMVRELLDALAQAEGDPAVRVLVLRGAGGHFCAGGDIADMAQARMKLAQQAASGGSATTDGALDPVADVNAQFGRLCLAYARSPLPVVAALEGTVMGGGFGLACVADVTLAAATAVFRLPETSLGVIPAQIAPFLIERLGPAEARRLAVTGERVDATQALTIRLVHEVLPDADALDAAVQRIARHIIACAPGAIAATKALMARARYAPAADLIDEAAALFSRAVQGPEGQEGTQAFLQKRAPSWAAPASQERQA